MTETFDLSKIRKGLQIQDEELLNKYLKEIWSDLSKRTKDTTKGITKVTFNKYYDLPGIISERLFSCFDKDKDAYIAYAGAGVNNRYSAEKGELLAEGTKVYTRTDLDSYADQNISLSVSGLLHFNTTGAESYNLGSLVGNLLGDAFDGAFVI